MLAFRYACSAHQLSNENARQVLAQIFSTLSDELDLTHLPLPDAPPERWSDRKGRKENAPTFVRRVYGQYLHGGFTRAMLRDLDMPLYQALAIWERRHPDDQLYELPKKFYRPRNSATALAPN